MKKKVLKKHEAILWNIALPGFAQIISGKILKGILFILLEIIINVQANFNLGILYSFNGETHEALEVINFQWLMFYPCLYMFALYDGFREADGEVEADSYLPFVFGAFFVTVGLMYSPKITLFGVFVGPIFLPMLSLIPGLMIGFLFQLIIRKTNRGQ